MGEETTLAFSGGRLSDNKVKRLEQIGFVIDVFESYWKEMLDALERFKEEHGDCNVPLEWPENKQLAKWVDTQRKNYRSNRSPASFSKDKIDRLEKLGFIWCMESYWEEMFDALKRFKEEHGDCNVPLEWPENKQLAKWVDTQRIHYRKKTLGVYEIHCLESIGFEWYIYK